MGGVAGHLMHLYDNPDLTASEMTKILTSAAGGELVGTEKTDGFNIYLSFVGGEARYARNKGDMRKGGGAMKDLIAREFAGGEKIKKVYLDAFGSFERAMQSLSPESRQQLFGGESPIFLNTEIQGPGANNLVNYDANILSIHATGHKYYDIQSDTVMNADSAAVSRISNHLDAIIDQMEEINAGLPFSVKRTAVMRLQGIDEGDALEDVLYRINQAGFTGDMTMAEYINNKLSPIIQRAVPSATGDLLSLIIDHIKEKKGRKNIRLVRKMLAGPEEGEALTTLLSRKKQLLNDAIAPIEEAIHDFAVELLRGVESAYILDNSAEMERVRADVASAIEQIAAYDGPGSDEAQEILIKQLKKIKSHENITSAVEGFVFSWDGNTYKFTGNFAPANQILGLFKYGRGSAPPIERRASSKEPSEPINEAEATPPADSVQAVKRKVAVIPGGFKSPHRGHFTMAQKYARMVDKVIVFVSPLSRPTPSGKEITSEDSVRLWKEYIDAYGLQDKIDIKVSSINSPVRLVFDFVANGWSNEKEKQVNEPNPDYAQAGDLVILGVSTKGGDDSRFTASAQEYAHPQVRVAAGREWAIAAEGDDFVHSQTGVALSASHMRACEDSPQAAKERARLKLPADPLEALAEFLPTRLRNDVARIHASLFNKQMVATEGLVELVGSLLAESYIEEISAMGAAGGGAVEGAPGQKKKKKKQDTLIREDDDECEDDEETTAIAEAMLLEFEDEFAAVGSGKLKKAMSSKAVKKAMGAVDKVAWAGSKASDRGFSKKEINTVGDLRKLMKTMKAAKAGKSGAKRAITALGGGALFQAIDGVRKVSDLYQKMYNAQDNFLTGTGMDALNVDDNVAKIIDDRVENAFLKHLLAKMKSAGDDEPLPNATSMIQAYLRDTFDGWSVAGGQGATALAAEGKATGAGQQNKDREEGYPLGGKKNKKNQDTIIREDDEDVNEAMGNALTLDDVRVAMNKLGLTGPDWNPIDVFEEYGLRDDINNAQEMEQALVKDLGMSEACGDEDETWRASGERMPSKINTLDYVERAPHYDMGDDVQPPSSPDERLDADPWPPPIPKMPHEDDEQLDILRRLVKALGQRA